MTAISFSQILASPLLARLLVLACATAIFLIVRRKDTEGQAAAFIATIGLLVIRDLLVTLFPIAELQNLSDIFYFGFALFIFLAPFKKARIPLIAALVVNAAVAGLYLATIFARICRNSRVGCRSAAGCRCGIHGADGCAQQPGCRAGQPPHRL